MRGYIQVMAGQLNRFCICEMLKFGLERQDVGLGFSSCDGARGGESVYQNIYWSYYNDPFVVGYGLPSSTII